MKGTKWSKYIWSLKDQNKALFNKLSIVKKVNG